MKNFLVILFIASAFSSFSQNWQQAEIIGSAENESLNNINLLSNGNIVVSGVFENSLSVQGNNITAIGEEDIYFGIYTSTGVLVDLFNIGGEHAEFISSVDINSNDQLTFYGNYIQSTKFGDIELSSSFSNQGLFLCQYNTNGNLNWAQSIDGRLLNINGNITHDNEDNILVTGYFLDSLKIANTFLEAGSDQGDVFVAKFDAEGNLIWAINAGETGIIRSTAIQIDSNNDIIIGGSFQGSISFHNDFIQTNTSDHDVFIAKVSSNGEFEWGKKFGGVLEKEFSNLVLDESNNIYATGNYIGVMSDDSGWEIQTDGFNRNGYLIKLFPNGQLDFGYSLGGQDDDFPLDIAYSQGKLAITGYFNGQTQWGNLFMSAQNSFDGFVSIIDTLGTVLQLVPISGSDFIISNKVIFDQNGELIIGGNFRGDIEINNEIISAAGDYDAFWLHSNSTVGLTNIIDDKNIDIYPNPGFNIIHLITNENVSGKILNIEGKTVLNFQSKTIDIHSLPQGMYFIILDHYPNPIKWVKK